jgi:hypothetical protein
MGSPTSSSPNVAIPVSPPIAAQPKIVGIASGRTRQIALGFLGAGFLLDLFGGDFAGLSFFFFFAALGMLLQSVFLLRWGLAFIGSVLLLLLAGIPRSEKRTREIAREHSEVNSKAAAEKTIRDAPQIPKPELSKTMVWPRVMRLLPRELDLW